MSSSANKHRRDERPASFAATTSFVQIALRIPALRLTAFCRQEARCRHASRAASLHTRNRMAIDRLPTMTADRREPPPTPSFAVLYSDSRYIAVYKPPDVRIDGPLTPTVQTFAAETLAARPPSPDALNPRRTTPGQAPTPKIHNVHRLDYATSGVMLVALTRPAAAIAAHQFQTRAVQKTYTGIVHGTLASPITATASIAPTEAFRMAAHPSGRSATTRIVPVRPGVYRGAPVTLVRFHPVEGRRHQIRVHASSLFYPIVGDATCKFLPFFWQAVPPAEVDTPFN